MPVITISSIKDQTKTSKKGAKYKVTVLEGTKLGTEDHWSTDIFKNNTKVLEDLDEFGPGEVVNVKFKKSGDFFDIVAIEEPTEENLEYAKREASDVSKSTGGAKKSFGGKKSSGMSKEEWAEKDRLTNIRISKAVALKAAIDNTKVGTKAKTIMAMADELLPYLLNEKVPTKKDKTAKESIDEVFSDDDGLDPIVD